MMINFNCLVDGFASELVSKNVNKNGSNNLYIDSGQHVSNLAKTITMSASIDNKDQVHKVAQSGRADVEARIFKPIIRKILNKQRVSPLYLINGTVCRFVNFRPVCTTIATTGLSGR